MMKKNSILTILLSGMFMASASAQVTINRSHLVKSGQKVVQATDTSFTGVAIATSGPNKTWDYSSLGAGFKDTLSFGNKDWYPGYQNFPAANMGVVNSSEDSSVTFLKIDNTQLSIEGVYSVQGGQSSSTPVHQKLISLPASYNGTFKDSSEVNTPGQEVGVDPDGPGPYPTVDSIRGHYTQHQNGVYDGYGTLKTPLGDFNSLKESITQISTTDVEMHTNGSWKPMPQALKNLFGIPSQSDTSYQHLWWTNDDKVGFPLLTYSFMPGETVALDPSWLQVKPQTSASSNLNSSASFAMYPNPASNLLNISFESASEATLEVSDLNGKLLISKSGNTHVQIDISALPRGVYTVKVIADNTLLGTEKFVKQ